jgi:tRNA threonylcarbamoyladenosine biosynthesis protein TsaE
MPVLDRQSLEFISRSPEQTRRVGMRLGALLNPGDLVCLIGDLGAGKTTLVQGMAAGWGSLDRATSPSFVLVNLYRRPMEGSFFHVDAYRLNSPAEAQDLDVDGLLEQGPVVVEWADRVHKVWPSERLWVTLSWVDDSQRDMVFSAQGMRYQELLNELRRHIFGVAA